MSNEDVIPKWALPLLGSNGATYLRLRGREVEKRWVQGKLELRQRCVCVPCNNGWMSRLEYAAKPLLEPMILGRSQELQPDECGVVAAWAVKTALLLQAADKASVIPAEHYREVRDSGDRRLPPPDVQVWLGHVESKGAQITHLHVPIWLGDVAVGLPAPNAYGATFSYVHLAFQVLWAHDCERVLGVDLLPVLRQLWPIAGPVSWPPPRVIDQDALQRLAWGWGEML
jgi:hypothetical protein